MRTHPPGSPPPPPPPPNPSGPTAPSGPGRMSDRALIRVFDALPVGLGIVLAVAAAIAGRGAL